MSTTMPSEIRNVLRAWGPKGDADALFEKAIDLERRGHTTWAMTVCDRAWGLAPDNSEITARRAKLLDHAAVVHHGIRFRYIPAGTFMMGSDTGQPDEGPAHPVQLKDFWLAETPMSWSAICQRQGWSPPPSGMPSEADHVDWQRYFLLREGNKIRMQYCEDHTLEACDWHAHANPNSEFFDPPRRDNPHAIMSYDTKPAVSIAWQDMEALAETLSDETWRVCLPTEAQWEKAARGGRIGQPYPWGDAPPDTTRCDCDRFDEFSILPMRTFAPNGYGLYAMSGGVWEWTRDWYDAQAYTGQRRVDPSGPAKGVERVLRGGSWADCPDVATVSFRASRASRSELSLNIRGSGGFQTPNIGVRLALERQVTSTNGI